MRKLLFLFTAVALIFASCSKDNQKTVVQPTPDESTSIEFKIEPTGFDLKSENVPECSDLSMDYVKFVLRDATGAEVEYKTLIYTVNEEYLTQVLKLDPGTYFVTSFLVFNDNGTPGDESDDIIIRAAPEIGSEYWDLMEFQLDLEFTVDAFFKKQIEIDVLCFEELFFQEFGFTWFNFHDVKIEYQCFFGDICTGKLDDFRGGLYDQQPEGVQMDMPAIFDIKVYKTIFGNDLAEMELLRTFSNRDWLGVGQCLEVYWPNRLEEEEEFTFELWVYLPTGEGFEYRHIHTWTFWDENCPDPGQDGVVEFVLGNCQYEDSDLILPYWMDLPPGEFNMFTHEPALPGSLGTFMDVTLSGIPPGYDIKNQMYGVWCGDFFAPINVNTNYLVTAYSSLAPMTWPVDLTLNQTKLDRLNFFFNKLPELIPGFEYDNTMAHWGVIQNTIWAITDGIQVSGDALAFYNYVIANSPGYEIPPGGWAAILFWQRPEVQLVFIVVDP